MKLELCLKCMSPLGENGVCPNCGGQNDNINNMPHQLPPGTILNGRYLVGRVLGEGGFGITYIGWDLALDLKVAVKEYYPAGYVSRDSAATHYVTGISVPGTPAVFENGKNKCMNEAKAMAKLDGEREVVRVRDYFLSNNTAYIIMDFVEGITLKGYVDSRGGRLSMNETLSLLKPLMGALSRMHQKGLIHRDISADNIMITRDGEARILDFGAAKSFELPTGATVALTLKRGFSPVEQYSQTGEQGPWTDVYAMSATIYYCVTGKMPYESVDRLTSDPLENPQALGAVMTKKQEKALMRGMAVQPDVRIRGMQELMEALEDDCVPKSGTYIPRQITDKQNKKPSVKKMWPIAAAGVVVLVVLAIVLISGKGGNQGDGVDETVFGNTSGNISNQRIFLRDGYDLWFADGKDALYYLDTESSSYVEDSKLIYEEGATCLNLSGDAIYFLDVQNDDIFRCNRDGQNRKLIYNGEGLYDITYMNNGGTETLYFQNDPEGDEDYNISSLVIGANEPTVLYSGACFAMTVTENYIFYIDMNENGLWRMGLDGSEKTLITDLNAMGVVFSGGRLFIPIVPEGDKPNYVLMCDENGENQSEIVINFRPVFSFNIEGDYIYYVNDSDGYIHRANFADEAAGDKVLAKQTGMAISLSQGYMYYQFVDDNDNWHAEAVDENCVVIALDING